MIDNNEKNLLNFIKYSPVLFITLVAILVNILIYIQNDINFKNEVVKERKTFIENKKKEIKKEVEKVYHTIYFQRTMIEKELKSELKQKVYEAYSIIESLYMNYHYLGRNEVLKLIKDALRNVRFNQGRGYFFIDDINGIKLLQPISPNFEGKSFLDYKDTNGYQFVKTITNTIKENSERFDEYYWPKPNSEKSYRKISFYKTFKPLNFAIGAGEYVDSFTKNVQKHLLENRLSKITFGKNGYIFILNYKGDYLTHIRDALVGTNRLNTTDNNGLRVNEEIIKLAQKGGGYISYDISLIPDSLKPSVKTSYIKGINDWQWAIGAGFYEDEINVQLKKKEEEQYKLNKEYMKRIFLISLLISFILIIISVYISQVLNGYFIKYNKKIEQEMEDNRKKDSILYQQSKMAAMGEMLANIAHQWRQPLSVITSIATSIKLQKELKISSEESEKNALDNITKNAEYLSHTIDDFRDFFKTNRQKESLSISNVIEKALLLLNPKLKHKSVNIVLEITEMEVFVYENELIQVLMNIINNAQDAFDFEQKEKTVFIYANKDNDDFIIKIKDNAGGIDNKILNRVFEPYFTTKHQAQGTGIGLYMVKEIITRHMNGTINVTNREFKYKDIKYTGAEFLIRLINNGKESNY